MVSSARSLLLLPSPPQDPSRSLAPDPSHPQARPGRFRGHRSCLRDPRRPRPGLAQERCAGRSRGPSRLRAVALPLALALALATPSRPAWAISDPLEPINRFVYSLNSQVGGGSGAGDIAESYRDSVPVTVRQGIRNILSNLWEPVTALASVMSLDFENAGAAGMRFLVNSTVGLLGYYDVARDQGWISRYEDLGQVPCSYGLPEGPLLMLPFVGATTIPDLVGRVVTIVAGYQVVGRAYLPYRIADRVVKVLNGEVQSLSPAEISYEDARDQYLRQRMADCRNWPRPPVIVPLSISR